MEYIELPVCSTFAADNVWYIVKESVNTDSCEGCHMVGKSCYNLSFPFSRSGEERSDSRDVIFVRLEDSNE